MNSRSALGAAALECISALPEPHELRMADAGGQRQAVPDGSGTHFE
jgi:hypothetical protein